MIEFSERESKLFNLKFGRATIPSGFNDWDQIIETSNALELDYLRVKVVDPDSHFLAQLSLIAPRSYLMGIIRLYKKKPDPVPEEYINSDLIFKKVNPTEKLFFKELIKEVYSGLPMGYFQYPEISESFPLHLQLENISSYFSDYFSGSEDKKEAYIGYINDKAVTCFVMDFGNPKVASCLYAGVVQAFRSKAIFKDAITYLTTLSQSRGIRQVTAGGRLENVSSQYGMSKEIGICYAHEWVYMLCFKKY